MIHTQQEHERITGAGYDDHMARVQIPEGNYYVLDFKHTKCPYLETSGKCGIEEVKSNTCRAFPAHIYVDEYNKYVRTSFKSTCPARNFLPEEFKQDAAVIAKKHFEDIRPHIQEKILTSYFKRDFPGILEDMCAVVTMPPAKQRGTSHTKKPS